MPSTYRKSETPSIWKAPLLGRIEGCTNPESCDLLPDGETFVFGNCALIARIGRTHPTIAG